MLNWYKDLYLGDTAKKKQKQYKKKIEQGKLVPGIYVLTLASNPQNAIDIYPAEVLIQKTVQNRLPVIIGLARGYWEALQLVESITKEVYEKTGTGHIRAYLEELIIK